MWWQWSIFVAVLLGIIIMFLPLKKLANIMLSKNDLLRLCLFYLFADLFYMSFIINSIIYRYLFGVSILFIIFYDLIIFIPKSKKGSLEKWIVLQDIITGIFLTIYLIYNIPSKKIEINGILFIDSSLREIVTAIVAAIYGGMLTLAGVAWTIKKGDTDRKEDLKRIKLEQKEENRKIMIPYLTTILKSYDVQDMLKSYSIKIEKTSEEKNYCYHFKIFTVKNISNSHIFLIGIRLNNQEYFCENRRLIEKGADLDVSFSGKLRINYELKNMHLMVEDVLGNTYYVKCNFTVRSYAEKFETVPNDKTISTSNMLTCWVGSVDLPILQKEC